MKHHSLSGNVLVWNSTSRRLGLILLAVALPSLALIGLGTRLLVQESRLAETDRGERLELAQQRFAVLLDSLAQNAALTVGSDIPSKAVVLSAQISHGQLLPTRIINAPVNTAYQQTFDNAERLEYASRNWPQSIKAYERALELAPDEASKGLVLLALARLSKKDGVAPAAQRFLNQALLLSQSAQDEFGIPVALFAASELVSGQERGARVLEAITSHINRPVDVTAMAAYHYRALRDSLLELDPSLNQGAYSEFVDEIMASVRLRDDFGSVDALLGPLQGLFSPWTLYADDQWLVGKAAIHESNWLVALDQSILIDEVWPHLGLDGLGIASASLSSDGSPPYRYLGPRYKSVFGLMTASPEPSRTALGMQRNLFIVLAGLLVISLLVLGVVLLLRDTRRELEMARIRSEFVSSVSHELKTPLTAIRMYAETLRIRKQDEATREAYLDTIVNESSRLTRLLNNVLDFSRIENGSRDYQIQPSSLTAILDTTLETLSSVMAENQVELETDVPKEDVMVHADSDAIEQVLLNLIGNSIKFSEGDRRINIAIQPNEQYATMTLTDNGLGIPQEELPYLFDPYFRSSSARTAHIPGTGLGLSIVKHTIESHGGKIWAESKENAGTSVSFTLPMA